MTKKIKDNGYNTNYFINNIYNIQIMITLIVLDVAKCSACSVRWVANRQLAL